MAKILIIGGGAAGMAAAVFLGEKNHQVHLFEKNEKLGKKLFITGKGRCNITNTCDDETFFKSVVTNAKFLYSAFYGYSNQDVVSFFENLGLAVKEERGGRIFPVSDHSSDVIRILEKRMKELDVKVHLKSEAETLLTEEGENGERKIKGIRLRNGAEILGEKVIVATGGFSYQATGSTGDGYTFAKEAGHTVTQLRPALVPIATKEEYVTQMQGLALKNIRFTVKDGKKVLYDDFGELLFTHFGISGPLVLTASSYIGKKLEKKELRGYIDLKAALTEEQLDARLLREFEAGINRQFKNVITGMFPAKLYPVILELGGIAPDKKVNEITRKERQDFIHLVKHFPLTLVELRPFREAIITQGGVKVKEINPKTMESKLVKGLYFIGEVLDLDAVTGGFNLQIAWSTAKAAAEFIEE
ncbi:NAD(P)/FAD-dependent oxidoreductase [Lachnospiraceae bacterium AM25-11LB]|mgnify:FL=1|jgi:predicted Rossmann fold flavoprotein|uniref:NAD(P)/FAD-dependent oxidoreductase n=1 Tax=Blautia hansenii TaxID=1322 RepID=UPI000E3F6B9F|nr:NAD(P)/FAD-dependent oxidoreductase [Lachnospiraceae bacterium AM25-22]RGD08565.1 NAD(P)/FAD-dependent oxidoreductase [Lachnospiraceae bacterium AM25-11LB]RJW12371.1 NAD(P)/FAD-dependent oxidoreductase [Lachnospiraceae bacterium AM25-40]RJW16447.1 NAD(P)/FAD-dependent oxidoreductase [Lachnospiraceae bacterium AM25-39]